MRRIAFLIARTDTIVDGNYRRFANALISRGDNVYLLFMESLAMADSTVTAAGVQLRDLAAVDDPFTEASTCLLTDFDIVWIMSLGMRHSFLDKMQLLFTVQTQCRIINSLDAIMHFKSKYFTARHPDVWKHPSTWASNQPAELFDVMRKHGGQWIVKPPASSFGRDVYLLSSTDPNAHVILESMCGGEQDQFCLLQRYVEEIRQGEKRVIIAGGKPVGQYLRTATRDHRTNAMQGAQLTATGLSEDERAYCERIGQKLRQYGAEFVGMDLAYPWVIEFNVINPGGVLTIEDLTGVDISDQILDNILPT
jgi:glutathione synthase